MLIQTCRETRQQTLEEIAAAFGDQVIDVSDAKVAEAAAEQQAGKNRDGQGEGSTSREEDAIRA